MQEKTKLYGSADKALLTPSQVEKHDAQLSSLRCGLCGVWPHPVRRGRAPLRA